MNFSCGYVISEHDGGGLDIEILRPIHTSYNSSRGTKNMKTFMKDQKLGDLF